MRFVLNPFTGLLDACDEGEGPSPGEVITLTGNTGGAVNANGSGNIFTVGQPGTPDDSNITVVGAPSSHLLTMEFVNALGLVWDLVGGSDDFQMEPYTGWQTTGFTDELTTFLLPTAAALGDIIILIGNQNPEGGWQISYQGTQYIQLGTVNTTAGSGTLSSSSPSDSVLLFCIVASTTNPIFTALPFGNLQPA